MRCRYFCIALTVLLVVACRSDREAALEEEELRVHVSYLASDELEGRDTGSDGIRRAEEYIAGVFEKCGLPPLPGQIDHFLEFPLYYRGYKREGTFLSVETDASYRSTELGVDFKPFFFSGLGRWDGELVFAGYGITAPEYDYDDYEGLDVKGRFVLVFRHEPDENDPESAFAGTAMTRHALFTEKAEKAQRNGALGMLLVTDPLHHAPGDDLRADGVFSMDPSYDGGGVFGDRMEDFPSFHLSRELVRSMLEPELNLEEMQAALDRGDRPAGFSVPPLRVSAGVEVEEAAEVVESRNVAAYLEGRDPKLKEEIVIVGAHHDHIGRFEGPGDAIYNGADDNASGVAGVLALARLFSKAPRRPNRSIAFVTFSAEEKGLFGAQALLRQLSSWEIAFMVNLDMIGRNPDRDVLATVEPREAGNLLEEVNESVGLPLTFRNLPAGTSSDAEPFKRKGVPTLFITTGLHEDYHRVTDHADKIEYARMVSILDLCYRFVKAVADGPADGQDASTE